jgi:hypothetical protein
MVFIGRTWCLMIIHLYLSRLPESHHVPNKSFRLNISEKELRTTFWVRVDPHAFGVRLPLLGRGIFDTGANHVELCLVVALLH